MLKLKLSSDFRTFKLAKPLPRSTNQNSHVVAVRQTNTVPPSTVDSRQTAAAISSLALGFVLSFAPVAVAADRPSSGLELKFESPKIKQSLEDRDKAMDFQCKGGMFDCDGDRRDYAKKQYQNFVGRMEGKPAETTTQEETSTQK